MKVKLMVIFCTLLCFSMATMAQLKISNHKSGTYKDPLDLSARNTAVSPAQNFFEYANGTWFRNTKIPPDQAGWGGYITLAMQTQNEIKGILDSCASLRNPVPGSPAQQIGDLYASYMDSLAVEKAGLSPLHKNLEQISSIKNVKDLLRVISSDHLTGYGAPAPFSYSVDVDLKNSNVQFLEFWQGGLGLPNKTYYFKTDSSGKAILKAYHNEIVQMLTLSGESKASAIKSAKDIIKFETKLAAASKSPVELRDPHANYHLLSTNAMDKIAPQLHWPEFIKSLGLHEDTIMVGQPEFFKSLSQLLVNTPLPIWKEYLEFRLIRGQSYFLSSSFFNAAFAFNKVLSGTQKPLPRWLRACLLVNGGLPDALGKIYVERYFPPSSKSYMETMVDNLKAAFREHIQNLNWMSDSTKTKAIDKLNAMVKRIGYPDKWKDYSSIHINRNSLIGNMRNIGVWNLHYNYNKLGKPVDKSEWFMSPPTVNAYYSPQMNNINFPAGYLQPPFYFQHGDDAVNYGAIGATIGHEMTHGFDDQGSQFDKDGNLKNWWTNADKEKFDKLTNGIVKQFDGYTIKDSIHLNGKLTEGENIADLGGLAIAYTAFKKTKEGQSNALIDGLTPDQRFFLSYAQGWQVKRRPQSEILLIRNDPHSPEQFRANGPLSNMPAFYKAFNVKPGDGMYRAESVRVKIW